MTAPGTTYTVGNTGSLTGGTGTGAEYRVDSIGTGGVVSTYTITDFGTGYVANDVLTLDGHGASDCTITVNTVIDGMISTISIINAGSGYTVADELILAGHGDGLGKIEVATVDVGVAFSKTTTITNIVYPHADSADPYQQKLKPVITLADPLTTNPLTGTQTISDLSCVGVDTNFSFTCNFGEIVLEEVLADEEDNNEITYTEWVAEEYTSAGVSSFQRQFTVEPECMNILLMKPDNIISKLGDVENWRLRLDNKDLTNRVVNYHSPLSLDRISMTLGDASMNFRNSNELYQSNNTSTTTAGEAYKSTNKLLLIANPLPITQMEKQVQVNIQASAATITDLILYKQCVRKSNRLRFIKSRFIIFI